MAPSSGGESAGVCTAATYDRRVDDPGTWRVVARGGWAAESGSACPRRRSPPPMPSLAVAPSTAGGLAPAFCSPVVEWTGGCARQREARRGESGWLASALPRPVCVLLCVLVLMPRHTSTLAEENLLPSLLPPSSLLAYKKHTSAASYHWCTVYHSGQDVILFVGLSVVLACVLRGKLGSTALMLAGEFCVWMSRVRAAAGAGLVWAHTSWGDGAAPPLEPRACTVTNARTHIAPRRARKRP